MRKKADNIGKGMKNVNRKGKGRAKKNCCNRANQLDKDVGSKVDLLSLTSNNREKKPAKAKHRSYNPTGSNNTGRGSGVQNTPDENTVTRKKVENGGGVSNL